MTTPPPFPALETERLLLREIVADDAPALFEIHGDAHLMQWFGSDPLADVQAAQDLVKRFAGWRELPNPGVRWGLQVKGEPGLIGTCGLFAWNRTWRKCTVGYELHGLQHGKGFMHEALRTALTWGFTTMAVNRVEATVDPDNAASIRSLERLGFVREGHFLQHGFWAGRYHDSFQYSMLRDRWAG